MKEITKLRIGLAISILVLGTVLFSVMYVEEKRKELEEQTFTLCLGKTTFILNETGIIYNNTYYTYDDLFESDI